MGDLVERLGLRAVGEGTEEGEGGSGRRPRASTSAGSAAGSAAGPAAAAAAATAACSDPDPDPDPDPLGAWAVLDWPASSDGDGDEGGDVPLRAQLDFARRGHACLRSFLPPDAVGGIGTDLIRHASERTLQAYRQKVEVAAGGGGGAAAAAAAAAAACRTVEDCCSALERMGVPSSSLPFLQHFNAWRVLPTARRVATSPRLASAAALLLDVPSVRLYQDSVFHKRPGDGPTPWHSDAR